MNASDASRTALATSLMRALHSRADPSPLLDDPWGDRLVPSSIRAAFRQAALDRVDSNARTPALASPETVLDRALRASAAYADVIVRARYTEDALQEAVARGIDQYVIIGAGFDSFACRRPAYADRLNVFEVDHPATQTLKRQRLDACGVALEAVYFVSADLSTEDLQAALARSSYQQTRATFFSWLGVTMYLTREANRAALRAIASCATDGSELVFTYIDEAVFGAAYADNEAFSKLKTAVSASGEAFLSGFDPRTIGEELQEAGLELLEDLNGDQMVARYDPDGVNGLQSNSLAHIAHVRVRKGQNSST
jgi:methyltransferase (TIGR00027 family)